MSVIGLGRLHLAHLKVSEDLNERIVKSALDRDITFMDNCWDDNEGASELRMGRALRDGYRDKVFLMTKVDGNPESAA